MKKFTNQFNGSHADRINNGGGRFRRIVLFPLMLFMLLLVPTSMMAQTDYDNTVTFTALAGNPQGFTNETYAQLFDGKKTEDNFSKWCCKFSGSANVIFAASKAGVPVGYTITTGNDNFTSKGRNPMSWKLYGNNVGKDGEWTLIQEVNNDTKLQDVNYTSYDFTCGGGKSYKYFKWEISAIHSGDVLQVGEFELKLQTCTHTNADGSSALGNAIKTVETTCTEHGYTTYKCSICHSIVKKYKTDELKKHTLTYHEAKDGVKEHWQCDVCHKYFSDADATQEVSYASLLYPAYAVFEGSTGTLTFKCSPSKPEGAYDLNRGWSAIRENIKKVVFDASFANARPTSCCRWFADCFYLTEIDGIENLNTQNVTDMSEMFTCCYALTSLDVSNFNTQNVEDMTDMFLGCEGLSLLDLSNFNTANVMGMSSMFSGCSTLQTIFASDKFVTDKVSGGDDMFISCENLKGFIDYISNRDKTDKTYANYTTGYFTKLVGKNGEKKIGAAGEALTTENLVLDDGKDFVAYDQFAAKNAFYIRVIPEGSTWGTLCLPFAIDQSQETECKFYRLTGIDNDNECITLESYEGAEIPAGTPVLFKMNENEPTLSISVQNVGIVKEPVAGTNVTEPEAETASDVNLVGSFTKIGGNGNLGLDKYDYIIGKNKFWRVSDLDDGKGVGIKPMRAYIHPAYEYLARAAMLSIGKGDGTTAIDNLNAISNDANAEYYDANGRRTNGLQKGLNIVKRGSKTYKIMVK